MLKLILIKLSSAQIDELMESEASIWIKGDELLD